MKHFVLSFLNEEQGQDIVEYTLLVCFVVVVGIYWVTDSGSPIKNLWSSSNATLTAAETVAAGR